MTEEEKEQAMETGLLVFSKEVFGTISGQIVLDCADLSIYFIRN